MHSEGILAGEMKHGPLALVDEDMPLLVVATRDEHSVKMASVVQQLRARGGKIVLLATEGDEELLAEAAAAASGSVRIAWARFSDGFLAPDLVPASQVHVVTVPATVDCLQAVVNMVPLQLLAYYLATMRGHNVDQPRNLAKSVTVE